MYSPSKGKSPNDNKCFCPFRAKLPTSIYLGRCPRLCAFAPLGRYRLIAYNYSLLIFYVFALMSCRRPDMRFYFICKPQKLTRKIKAHIRRDSARGFKTLRSFYCFCFIVFVELELYLIVFVVHTFNDTCNILTK